MKKHEITPEQLLEIIEARKNNTNPRIDKKLYAVQLRGEGMTNTKIAEKLNITTFSACRWAGQAIKYGVQSFLSVNHRKPIPLKITSEQQIEIINALKNNNDPDVDKRLIAMLLRGEGMTNVEIAKKFSVSSASVTLWVNKFRKYGVPPLLTIGSSKTKPFDITPRQQSEIIEERKINTNPKTDRHLHAILLRSEGVSCAKIAKKFNVSLPCVYKWLDIFKKQGVRRIHIYPIRQIRKARPPKITKERRSEIIEARKINTDPKTDKYLHALLLRCKGLRQTEIEEKLELKPQTVAHLQRKLMRKGVRSFLQKSGRPKSNLNRKNVAKIA
jgi:transposase